MNETPHFIMHALARIESQLNPKPAYSRHPVYKLR